MDTGELKENKKDNIGILERMKKEKNRLHLEN